MPTPARKTQFQHKHYIARTISWNSAGVTTGLQVGTLPAGAVLDKTTVLTNVAFNGTVSATLSVGTTPTGTNLINATDVRTAVARVDTVTPAAVAGPLAADQAYYASVTFGGTVGSAGSAQVIIYYVPSVS